MFLILMILMAGAGIAQELTAIPGEVGPAGGCNRRDLSVLMEGPAPSRNEFRSNVDADGKFRVRGASPGHYKIMVMDDRGNQLSSQMLNLHQGATIRVNLPGRGGFDEVADASTVSVFGLLHKPNRSAYKACAKAQKFLDEGDHEHAIEAFKKAAAADPQFALAQANLGAEYARVLRLAEAEAAIREAVRLDPGTGIYQSNLALVLAKEKRIDEAVPFALRSVALDPSNAHNHLVLGCLLSMYPKDRASELSHLEFASRQLPEAHRILGLLYLDGGQ